MQQEQTADLVVQRLYRCDGDLAQSGFRMRAANTDTAIRLGLRGQQCSECGPKPGVFQSLFYEFRLLEYQLSSGFVEAR